eukprot:1415791-Rhodomonas_salina.2
MVTLLPAMAQTASVCGDASVVDTRRLCDGHRVRTVPVDSPIIHAGLTSLLELCPYAPFTQCPILT